MIKKLLNSEIIFSKLDLENYLDSYFVIDYNVEKKFVLSKKLPSDKFLIVRSGEKIKSFSGVNQIIKFFIDNNVSRSSAIVVIGGGTLLDLVGFCASIYKRGVNLHFIPTTLLSMADSSIGGKNAINFHKIKNLIGTFYLPKTVLIDVSFLTTLPRKHLVSGYMEILKIALLFSPEFYEMLRNNITKIRDLDYLSFIIDKSIDYKIQVVESDLWDKDRRKLLNFGHTIGHAIELVYNLPHGISIGIGMLYDMLLSNLYTNLNINTIYTYNEILQKLNVANSILFDFEKIINNITNDKKIQGKSIDLILLKDIGKPVIFSINYEQFIIDLKNLFEFKNSSRSKLG